MRISNLPRLDGWVPALPVVALVAFGTLGILAVPSYGQEPTRARIIIESDPEEDTSVVSAWDFETYCSGFTTRRRARNSGRVIGGTDDDMRSLVRQFSQGNIIYLRPRKRNSFKEGELYHVIRRGMGRRHGAFGHGLLQRSIGFDIPDATPQLLPSGKGDEHAPDCLTI